MSADRISEVLRQHQGYQAMNAQSTWVCSRDCGWRGDTNGGRIQWEAHVAERIESELQSEHDRELAQAWNAGFKEGMRVRV